MNNQTIVQSEPSRETIESINELFNQAIQHYNRDDFWDMFQDSMAGIKSMGRDEREIHNRAHLYRILENLFDSIHTVPNASFSVLTIEYKYSDRVK